MAGKYIDQSWLATQIGRVLGYTYNGYAQKNAGSTSKLKKTKGRQFLESVKATRRNFHEEISFSQQRLCDH